MIESFKYYIYFVLFIALLQGSFSLVAHEQYGVTRLEDLGSQVTENRLVKIDGAELAWADFAALRRDFLDLRDKTDKEIKEWVLDNFAYISEEQLKLNNIRQNPIPVDKEAEKIAYRPPRYGRAAVVGTELDSGGYVDIKGIGHAENSVKLNEQLGKYIEALFLGDNSEINKVRVMDHSDGLMSLGEAVAEVSRQNAAQRLFDLYNVKHSTNLQTVESYFIISVPSNILKDESEIPMALYARQSHIGRLSRLEIPKEIYIDPHGFMQRSMTDTAVDFGGVLIQDKRLVHNFDEGIKGAPLNDPQASKAWIWGHEVARAFVSGDKDVVYNHLEDMLSPITSEWEELDSTKALLKFRAPLDDVKIYQTDIMSEKTVLEFMKDSRKSSYMVDALKVYPRKKLNSLIRMLLDKGDKSVQEAVWQIMAKRPDLPSLDLIENGIRHNEGRIRYLAFEALSNRADQESFELIRIFFKEGDNFTKVKLMDMVAKRVSSEGLKNNYKKLILQANNDISPKVRTAAMLAIGESNSDISLKLATKGFFDEAESVRIAAVTILKKHDNQVAMEIIKKAATDSAWPVRKAAMDVLIGRSDKESLEILKQGIADERPSVVEAAYHSLRGRTDEASLELVRKGLNLTDVGPKESAIMSLKGRTSEQATEILEEVFSHIESRDFTRKTAIRALQGRTDKRAIDLLRRALLDNDGLVRDMALEVIGKDQSLYSLFLKDSDQSIQHLIIVMLVQKKDATSYQLLNEIVHDDNYENLKVKQALKSYLDALTPPISASSDCNSLVRNLL